MAKKQARPAAAVKASMKASPKQPNPFDLKKNKAKFDVLGRRVKGSTKNVVQARVDANTKRKKTLLVEYRQIRKANSFVDKRFGEGAMELSREQRALAKQQAQRQKREAQAMAAQAKGKGKKFALPEGEGSEEGEEGLTLTHRGKALGDMDEFEAPELDELDEDMVADLVRTYNFGGGDEGGPESKGADGRPKTRKQIMEEIIAKSKMYKAMKAKQREEDEAELEQLNNSFKELVRAHALKAMIKPVGYLKGIKVKPDDAGDAAYDTAARLLAQESRAAPGERTLSPEEVAEREATRLQALEKERLRRMRGEGGDDQPGLAPVAASGPVGGYAARRKRLRSSENEEEEEEEEEGEEEEGGAGGVQDSGGEEGLSALELRRRQRAAGSHPLQGRFRSIAAQVLSKYGVSATNPLVAAQADAGSGSGEEEEGESSSEGEGEEEEGEGDEEEEEEEGEEEEGEEGEEGEGEQHNVKAGSKGKAGGNAADEQTKGKRARLAMREEAEEGESSSEEEGESSSEEGEEEEEDEDEDGSDDDDEEEGGEGAKSKAAAGEGKARSAQPAAGEAVTTAAATKRTLTGSAHQSVTPAAPKSEKVSAELLGPLDLPFIIPLPKTYQEFAALVAGRAPEHLVLAVQRIRAFNAAALAADAKRGLQVLYGLLVQHFAFLAGELPLPLAHLDALLPLLLAMTSEVPFYAATVARARLKKMHERLSAALANPWAGISALAPAAIPASPPTAPPRPPSHPAGIRSGKGPQPSAPAPAPSPAPPPSPPPRSAWPPGRSLLLLRLLALLYPRSDRRHPVSTPLALLVAKLLAHCTACTPHEARCGLMLCGMALGLAAPAARFSPEPLLFLRDLLASVLPPAASQHATAAAAGPSLGQQQQAGSPPPTTQARAGGRQPRVLPGVLCPVARGSALMLTPLQPPSLLAVLQGEAAAEGGAAKALQGGAPKQQQGQGQQQGGQSGGQGESQQQNGPASGGMASGKAGRESEDAAKLGVLSAALSMTQRAVSLVQHSTASAEILRPLAGCLQALCAACCTVSQGAAQGNGAAGAAQQERLQFPAALANDCTSLLAHVRHCIAQCEASRKPLVQAARIRVKPVREFNPRFEEEGFALGRDYDPDRARAETRKLKRQLQKEKRGAVRELRRDATFMAATRDRERAVVDAERMDSQRKFYNELQVQESDFKSGGQRGLNPHLKKKRK